MIIKENMYQANEQNKISELFLKKEITQKMSPNELLEKSKVLGISGSDEEVDKRKNMNNEASNDESQKIRTINEDLEGKRHPETGVLYEKSTLPDGRDGVFPVFDSIFDVLLDEEYLLESDNKQFKYCNKKLKEAIENDPELKEKFTSRQLEEIQNGRTPSGYTWHHHQETGRMQLVPTEQHEKSAHTGGKSIWGGGKDNR